MMNVEVAKTSRAEHRISLLNRENVEIFGVTDVIGFDEQTVTLDTVCGKLAIEGAALHIQVLNIEQGIVTMDGRVDSVTYFETETKEKDGTNGFFAKLFR